MKNTTGARRLIVDIATVTVTIAVGCAIVAAGMAWGTSPVSAASTVYSSPQRDDTGRIRLDMGGYIDCGDGIPPCVTWDIDDQGRDGYWLVVDGADRRMSVEWVSSERLSDGTVWHWVERSVR